MARIETLYFIHHSHTDIGYTHDQPIVFDLHERFITQALTLAERSADSDSDGAFRWTVENTYVLLRWLRHASPREIERFQAMEKAGRIEVTGMFANLTPLLDAGQLAETLQPLRTLRDDYGFTITSAMNCDVNGESWSLPDLLLDAGIEGFTMAINTHFGGAPLARPDLFHWQAPSGRTLLAYSGWPYDQGWRYGIGRSHDDFEQVWWPRVMARLDEIDYPLPVVMVQSYHPFGDNGSAFADFVAWIDAWNASGKAPHIKFATPRQWWVAVKPHAQQLPVYSGDWTDYWNFGCGSSAREQTINRQSRARLRNADAFAAAELATAAAAPADADPWLARTFALHRDEAWDSLHFWDEHTWGADIAISDPDGDDTASQWNAKASFAYRARSLSLMLQRDALAALARRVDGANPDDLLLANPLPWPQTMTFTAPGWLLKPRGTPDDTTAGRHFQDRRTKGIGRHVFASDRPEETQTIVPPTTVPAFGYAVVPRAALIEFAPAAHITEAAVVETARHRLEFDRERGGVVSWQDRLLNHEWVDMGAGYPLNGFVHEEVADRETRPPRHRLFHMKWDSDQVERARGWKPGWRARRRTPTKVLSHRVCHTPLGIEVVQILAAEGIASPLEQTIFLPNYAEWVEFRGQWRMGLDDHPEATYLLFPFNLPDAQARLDLGPQAMRVEDDQIPGVCRDYFTVQNWVDFSNGAMGVTVATPDNPMIQLGDFHFGANRSAATLTRPMLLGWVTNTYWETNFRSHQPGLVTARYRVLPHAGPFDESQAHRVGLEAMHDAPLLQHMGEASDARAWPASGTLLALPEPPVMVLHVKPATGSQLLVRLMNASDAEQVATVGSGLLRITGAAACDLFGHVEADLPVHDGAVSVSLASRRVATLLLAVA
jgi:alpha-mannosidase